MNLNLLLLMAPLLAGQACLAQSAEVLPEAYAFLVKPYLQLGDHPRLSNPERLAVNWQVPDIDAEWTVRYRPVQSKAWSTAAKPAYRRVAVRGVEPHRVYSAEFTSLSPADEFDYAILKGGAVVFQARARARRSDHHYYQFAVFGDCAQNSAGQRAIAYQTWLMKPDFVFIPGDIVYARGRIVEYGTKFFPIYNAEEASPATGAPLLRSTLFIAGPGNHDIASPDLEQFPDSLAYFYYWKQPLNGPLKTAGAAGTPILKGPDADQQAFLAAAQGNFPQMGNFSFDYGNSHWLVLDSNKNVDWTKPELRQWVADDLKANQGAKWRFVAYHHPGFNSSKAHFNDQWMRNLSDVFEEGKVSIVFAGHVHNYQRSYPLTFQTQSGGYNRNTGVTAGTWKLDKTYDGSTKTKPDGVIYLVTGAGGAGLYNPEQSDDRSSWQEFTTKFVSQTHSFTAVEVKDRELTVRQIAADGSEVDRFTVTQ
ncbi:MAG TPA: metallophosphoesterase [Bryobacteraceae bacterium]|nr:metallophosphoesterase [Bryobacteraceae bacterium]